MRELIINVDEEGVIYVNGTQMDADGLKTIVEKNVESNPDQKVTVRGDKATSYANIVRVLDVCKGAGIQEPYLDTVIQQ